MNPAVITAYIEFDHEAGLFVGSIPQLPGAFTQASTLDELKVNLQEVAELVAADMLAHGEQPITSEFIGIQQLTIQL